MYSGSTALSKVPSFESFEVVAQNHSLVTSTSPYSIGQNAREYFISTKQYGPLARVCKEVLRCPQKF